MEELEVKPTKRRITPAIFILIGLVVVLVGAAAFILLRPDPPCYKQAEVFITQLDPLLEEWSDAITVASSTSRIALSPTVSNLQTIRREVSNLTPPDCAMEAQELLVSHMDYMIDGFLSFMADEEEFTVNSYFDVGTTKLDDFLEVYLAVKSNP